MEGSSALDRYLYAISILEEKYLCVRSVDLAHFLRCSRASVSAAVRDMAKRGWACMGENGALTLTNQGRERAKAQRQRISFFESILLRAGIETDIARDEAFAVSKAISDGSFQALQRYMKEKF